MGKAMTKVAGILLLIATIGLASCQALLAKSSSLPLSIEQQD